MEQMDIINAVSRMQKYIVENLDDVTLDDLSAAAGYSKYHAVRLFKEAVGKAPGEYIRALRLTKAAEGLRDAGGKIIDAALKTVLSRTTALHGLLCVNSILRLSGTAVKNRLSDTLSITPSSPTII